MLQLQAMRPAILVALALSLVACGKPDHPTATAAASASASSPASKPVQALGGPVTAALVPLSDIAKNPGHYANQTIATSGEITSVCQEMGCWMEIKDATGLAHVRMHGHKFMIPKNASGRMARVQATVLAEPDEGCAEGPPPDKSLAKLTKVDLDATGVELD
jgi:hypothetical protein